MKAMAPLMLLAFLFNPSEGFAKDWKSKWKYQSRGRKYEYKYEEKGIYRPYVRPIYHHERNIHYRPVVVVKERDHDGAAIAAGVLGGLAVGIILDRVLTPPPPPPSPAYYPPPQPPRSGDPYQEGYSEGYGQGVERGGYERYELGRKNGYEDGYEEAKSGRIF